MNVGFILVALVFSVEGCHWDDGLDSKVVVAQTEEPEFKP